MTTSYSLEQVWESERRRRKPEGLQPLPSRSGSQRWPGHTNCTREMEIHQAINIQLLHQLSSSPKVPQSSQVCYTMIVIITDYYLNMIWLQVPASILKVGRPHNIKESKMDIAISDNTILHVTLQGLGSKLTNGGIANQFCMLFDSSISVGGIHYVCTLTNIHSNTVYLYIYIYTIYIYTHTHTIYCIYIHSHTLYTVLHIITLFQCPTRQARTLQCLTLALCSFFFSSHGCYISNLLFDFGVIYPLY